MSWARIVGRNLRRLRSERGITQEELAHESKVALRLLGGIERGQRNPSVEVIGRLASALGAHPRDLFDEAIDAVPLDTAAQSR
jgi:transcriptional regulator with XRE-family HTH domain